MTRSPSNPCLEVSAMAPFPRSVRRSVLMTALALALLAPRVQSTSHYTHYFGNLHAHTSFSDGSGTPDEAYRHAKEHLDFIAITEHNHDEAERGAKDRADGVLIANDHDLYTRLKAAADAHTVDGEFVAFWGQEFSTISKGNHSNILQSGSVIEFDNGDYRSLFESLTTEVMQFNHPWDNTDTPNYGLGQLKTYAKLRAAAKNVRLIEVINGPGTKNETGLRASVKGERFYRHYLTRGLRLAPSANQDNHYLTWGDLTGARTVVLATELSRRGLLDAIRARRVYATTDHNLRVTFTVNGSAMGKELQSADRDLRIAYEIADDDESGAPYAVAIAYGNPKLSDSLTEERIATASGNHSGAHTLQSPHANTFVYLKITQHPKTAAKRDWALTAPVWVLGGQ
jgi:hypothetical protein